MDDINLEKLKTAIDQINSGVDVETAKKNVQYVNYNKRLIDKINVLKQIKLLNIDTLKFLYSIKLTDYVEDVESKVNAIYNLAKSAHLIEDVDLDKEADKTVKYSPDEDENEIAMRVVKKIIGG